MFARYWEQKIVISKHGINFVSRLCEQDKAIIDSKMKFVTYAA